MKKIGFISDLHIGLTTDNYDRTEEIIKVTLDFVKKCIRSKVDLVVFGGDIFHNNVPSEILITQFLRVLNLLQKYNLKTYIMVGNHDAIASTDRMSCLDFVKKLKYYPAINLISDIKCFKFCRTDIGDTYLTFYPHITKAHIEGTKYKRPQRYIDRKTEKIFKRVTEGVHHIVFSHLNVKGIIPGSEDNLLKKSAVYLPDEIVNCEKSGYISPLILQGHIHSKQVLDNVHIVGSPVFVSFGEKDTNKYFAIVHVPETFGEKNKVEFVKTSCLKMKEFDFDLTDKKEMVNFEKWADTLFNEENKIVKISFTINDDLLNYDFDSLHEKLKYKCAHLKPFKFRMIRNKVKRNIQQTIKLNPLDAVRLWIKSNKPSRMKERYALAKKFINSEG